MGSSLPDRQTLVERLEAAETRLEELEADSARLRERNARLRDENSRLRDRVQHLEHQIGQDSSNSHRPPSTDEPWDDSEQDDKQGDETGDQDSSLNQGAQPGHDGHHRELVDEQEVDEINEVKPTECECCGAGLSGDDIAPWRHQVFEIEIIRHVTEYQMHRLECQQCGHSQRADLPDGVPRSNFGDRLCGWASWLTGKFDLSKRDVEALIERGFEIPISLGSVCAMERRMQRALEPVHQEALETLAEAAAVWVDETGWFEQHERSWLWCAVADDETEVTVFRIDPERSRTALEKLVDKDFDGIVTSDRYPAYNGRAARDRQLCWQHLVRDFKGLIARDGPAARPARYLLTIAWLIFWTIDQIKRGKATWDLLRQRLEQGWRPATRRILEWAIERQDDPPAIFKRLLKREQALWTFAYIEEVEPTNNRAERAVRPAVIKRKLSFGTQSTDGSRFIACLLTVCETLRRQGRSVLDFLAESLEAWRHDRPPPTLVTT